MVTNAPHTIFWQLPMHDAISSAYSQTTSFLLMLVTQLIIECDKEKTFFKRKFYVISNLQITASF